MFHFEGIKKLVPQKVPFPAQMLPLRKSLPFQDYHEAQKLDLALCTPNRILILGQVQKYKYCLTALLRHFSRLNF
jgi:hypothetical protein